jgi:hypothetical protein
MITKYQGGARMSLYVHFIIKKAIIQSPQIADKAIKSEERRLLRERYPASI